jgi:hypothetical protein
MNINKARYVAYRAYRAYEQLAQLTPNVVSKKDLENKSDLEQEITQEVYSLTAKIVLDIVNPIFKEYPEIEEEIKNLVMEYKIMP